VMLQPFQYDPNEKNRHKFLVQTLVVPDGVTEIQESLVRKFILCTTFFAVYLATETFVYCLLVQSCTEVKVSLIQYVSYLYLLYKLCHNI